MDEQQFTLFSLPRELIVNFIINFIDGKLIFNLLVAFGKTFLLTETEKRIFKISKGLKYCLEKGYIEECKILIQRSKSKINNYSYVHWNDEYFFRKNCAKGNLPMLEWMWENFKPFNLHALQEASFKITCGNGHFLLAEWLWCKSHEINSPINLHIDNNEIFSLAVDSNNIELIKWLTTLTNNNSWINVMFRKLCRTGNLFGVEWMYNFYRDQIIVMNFGDLFIDCCCRGKISVATWLYILSLQLGKPINIHAEEEEAFIKSCSNGYIEMANWLWLMGNYRDDPINIHARNDIIIIDCCRNNRYVILVWLLYISELINEPFNIHINCESAFRVCCEKGYDKCAKLLWDICVKNKNLINLKIENYDCFQKSCHGEYLELTKWLWEIIKSDKQYDDIFDIVLNNNSFKSKYKFRGSKTTQWLDTI